MTEISGPEEISKAGRRASWRRYDQKRAGTPERKAQVREARDRYRQRLREARAAWKAAQQERESEYEDGPFICPFDRSTLRLLKWNQIWVCLVCENSWDA